MTQFASKQINKLLSSFVGMPNVVVTSANSINVTASLTTLLSTAGDGGTSVPLQVASSGQQGVITSGNNEVPVFDHASGNPIIIAGNQVYGRITFLTPNYTVSFYTKVGATETAATLNQTIDLAIPYRFSLASIPQDALITYQNLEPGAANAAGNYKTEVLTVTGNNSFSNLANAPLNPSTTKISVNGQELYAGQHFAISGNTISISAAQATAIGFTITTTDFCLAEYWA